MLDFHKPEESDLPLLRQYRAECTALKDSFDGTAGLGSFEYLHDWLSRIRLLDSPKAEKYGWFRTEVYLACENGIPVGIVSIRLSEDDTVMRLAGHIGYHVRPSMRRHGIGRQLLSFALSQAAASGISDPRVCLFEGNICSERTALACGLILDGEETADDGRRIIRFRTKP